MSENMIENKNDLILGDDFENALIKAAEVKNNNISVCKERNKNNYTTFYEVMLASRVDIQELMNKKGKHRTDDDKKKIKAFKKDTSNVYNQICNLISEDAETENDDEENVSKIEKMVQKITTVLKMMSYIGNKKIEEEFQKSGITLKYKTLEEECDMFDQPHIKETISRVFDTGKKIKEDINTNKEEIKTNIYENSVPMDLQYDKQMNPTGIKNTDFCKLVDLKAKMLNAKDDDNKEKIKDAAEHIAGEHVFQNARNELLNKKLIDISTMEE